MTDSIAHSFAPLATPQARVLVVGSVPGKASLAASAYYAHPRNVFWPLMADIVGFDASLPYAARVEALATAGIAVWDVIAACRRESSLDSAVALDTVALNDFAALFTRCPHIAAVYGNGGLATRLYAKRIVPTLPAPLQQLPLIQLPSTSPAYAAMGYADKRAAWRVLLHDN